jgi:hypothetical protein
MKKSEKSRYAKQTSYLAPYPSALELKHGYMLELLKKYRKNEPNIHFEQNFTMGSYRVWIRRTWCS